MSFAHLHNHSDFSALDGAATVSGYAKRASELGIKALALTDHGVMSGLYDFVAACRAENVHPILGMEAYAMPIDYSRTHREPIRIAEGGDDDISGGGAFTHMTLWAENETGLVNLQRMLAQANIDGYYRKPRLDIELFTAHAGGVLATTGCPSGEIATLLRLDRYDEAVRVAATYRDILGAGNYYAELMNHGIDVEKRAFEGLLRLAKDLNLPLVATNDCHYVHQTDATLHDAYLCVQSGAKISDTNRFKFGAEDFYLKSPEEMRTLWADLPQACDNTLVIAERCQVDLAFKDGLMPAFPTPAGITPIQLLSRNVREGLAARLGVHPDKVPQEYKDRAVYEYKIITEMGFADYFLIVADLIMWAKKQGILCGPGRGSVGSSIVAWSLGITELDPIKYGLFFERFLNPERVSMPDIDMDFDDRRRGEVIDYVRNKYGDDKVANIATYSVIKAKAALKDSARVMGVDYAAADLLTKAYPNDIMGKSMPLSGVFDPEHARHHEAQGFRDHLGSNPALAPVVEMGLRFEGLKRGYGMHAAGVIMSSKPLTDTVPLMRVKADGPLVTGYDYPSCESLGLLKMDFLGLSNLGTIDEALRHINANSDEPLSMERIIADLDDAAVYGLLSRGETLGVFQLDSPPMRALLQRMRPDRFDDIPAVLALYRPGPMGANAHNDYADRKNNRQKPVPIHPDLAESLADVLGRTHGLIVFQEDVMRIAQVLAGYSLAQADNLRRAMGKKKKEILDKEYVGFREGMKANGYSDAAVKSLWDVLVPFADYAFARPHAVAYGLVSYITAWLKAHYPAEYMAALLTTNQGDKDKVAIYLSEARRMGIKLLPPCVNSSNSAYTPTPEGIRVGLGAIRNVGGDKVQAIIDEREAGGPYANYAEFIKRVHGTAAFNSRVIDSLIRAGAMDSFGIARSALCSSTIFGKPVCEGAKYSVDRAMKAAVREAEGKKPTATKAQHAEGGVTLTTSLQGTVPHPSSAELIEVVTELIVNIPDLPEWPSSHLAVIEKEMLGLYVAHHPLDGKSGALRAACKATIAEQLANFDLEDATEQPTVRMAGMLISVENKTTRRGTKMGVFTLMDTEGEIDCVVFPHVWRRLASRCAADSLVKVRGRLDADGRVQVLVDEVEPIQG